MVPHWVERFPTSQLLRPGSQGVGSSLGSVAACRSSRTSRWGVHEPPTSLASPVFDSCITRFVIWHVPLGVMSWPHCGLCRCCR